MKKINFINFFTGTKRSSFDRAATLITKLIVPLYAIIIVSMHSMQGYKWYQLTKQEKSFVMQPDSFDNAIKNRAQVQESKQLLQKKITFLHQQKKDSSTKYDQLNIFYSNTLSLPTTATIKNDRFSLLFSTKTSHAAYQFLKALQSQPLVHKARIVHLNKSNEEYLVEVKGKFKSNTFLS